jgi:predicted dehydrogenase
MHHVLFLDPGHFHATLTLRVPHPRIAGEIVVYAPDSAERRDFLALVERFNARGARWRVDAVASPDPLGALIGERRGDVVVLAGKNGGKARTIRRLHDAGFHVLADKPWLVSADDLEDIRAALSGPPVATEVMTGRHDVAARLLKRLVETPEVFGGFRAGAPAIEMDSTHCLEKLVDGAPLRRPWWFFDVRVQGRGLVDIPTHMVDRAQWLAASDDAGGPGTPALISARPWPTRVPREAFARITGAADFPGELKPLVDGDALTYDGNAELRFRIGDVVTHAQAQWVLTSPSGGGDTSVLVAHGTRADVRLEQTARTNHRRQLVVEPHDRGVAEAVEEVVRRAQAELPGVRAERRRMADAMGAAGVAHDAIEIVVPRELDGGHEAHFALVLDAHLKAIDDGRWPADVAARTLAKYTLLAAAAAAT